MDGRIRFLKEPAPVVGSSPVLDRKTMISMNPIQKEGMDIPEDSHGHSCIVLPLASVPS